jgi:hypothetical protein
MNGEARAATSPTETFYEQANPLGEVVRGGLRYMLFYDPDRRVTIYVLAPGQFHV